MLAKTLHKTTPLQRLSNLSVAENSIDPIIEADHQPLKNVAYFFIIEGKRFIKIRYNEIVSIEASRCYINIHTTANRYLVIGSMVQLEKHLPRHLFCRIHRSWIVPVEGISEIGTQRIRVNDQWFPLGTSFRRRLLTQVKPYVFNRSYFK